MFASLIRVLRLGLFVGLLCFPLNFTHAVAHTNTPETIFEQTDGWYLSLRHTTGKSRPARLPPVKLSAVQSSWAAREAARRASPLIIKLSRLSISSSASVGIKQEQTLLSKAGGDGFANKTWSFMRSSGLNVNPNTKALVAWLDKERARHRITRGGATGAVLALDLGIETLESIKDGKALRGAQRENILMHLQTLLTFRIDQASLSR